jgi:hypothetical protein
MRGRILRTFRTLMIFITLFLLQSSGASQARPVAREPVPNHLAWRVFHESIAFHHEEAAKRLGTPASSAGPRTLFSKATRPNPFDGVLKKQFGLSPEQVTRLLSSGRIFLAELENIQKDAKAEVRRRYMTPPKPLAASRGPQKTIMERSKDDGYHAEVETKRAAALAAHLRNLRQNLTPAEFDKMTQWVQTSVASRIVIASAMPDARRRPSAVDPRIARRGR